MQIEISVNSTLGGIQRWEIFTVLRKFSACFQQNKGKAGIWDVLVYRLKKVIETDLVCTL